MKQSGHYMYTVNQVFCILTCLLVAINIGLTASLPTPASLGGRKETCGSHVCDTTKLIPDFCNTVEWRCEVCSSKTCNYEVCRQWDGCQPSTQRTTVYTTDVIKPTGPRGEDKSASDMALRETVYKLISKTDYMLYGIIGMGVVLAMVIGLDVKQRMTIQKLKRSRNLRGYLKARHSRGAGPIGSNDEDTMPMAERGLGDSGIQDEYDQPNGPEDDQPNGPEDDLYRTGHHHEQGDESMEPTTYAKFAEFPAEIPAQPGPICETRFKGTPSSMVF